MKKIDEIKKMENIARQIDIEHKKLKKRKSKLKKRRNPIYYQILLDMNYAEREAISDSKVNAGLTKYPVTNYREIVRSVNAPTTYYKIQSVKLKSKMVIIEYTFESFIGCGEYERVNARTKIPFHYFDISSEEIRKEHYNWTLKLCEKIKKERTDIKKQEKTEAKEKEIIRKKKLYEELKKEFNENENA